MARRVSLCCVGRGEMRWIKCLLGALLLSGCGKQDISVTHCPSLVQGCAVELGAEKVIVKTNTIPVPLKPFTLSISASSARQVNVVLQMQGMDMGLNRYRLLREPNGEWRATITLPVCVSGRRDWLMIVELDGERRAFAFQTPGN